MSQDQQPHSSRLPKGITLEQFVEVWQQARSAREATKLLGMDKYDASYLAGYLRRKGVPLKNFRSRKTDYSRLAELARSKG